MNLPAAPAIYLDLDTGIDDALALTYLVRAGAQVAGIGTVSGNVEARNAGQNTLDLLQLLNRTDIPVAVGATHPIDGQYPGAAAHVHGTNGIGNARIPRSTGAPQAESAAEMLLRLADRHNGGLHIIALGPLTNIALALAARPDLPSRIAGITVMGGAARVPGNVTPTAEANIYSDPLAANSVFAADWSVTLVPLDVTMTHTLDLTDRAALLSSDDPVSEALGEMLGFYMSFHLSAFGRRMCAYHDALASAIAIGRVTPARQPAATIRVDLSAGATRGATNVEFLNPRSAHVDAAHTVVLGIDGDPKEELMRTLVPEHAWTDMQ